MDLTPRQSVPAAPRVRRRSSWFSIVVLALVVLAGGVMVLRFLDDAVDYYCNVDEIGSKQGCEVGRRIRIQGVVRQGTVSDDGTSLEFFVSYGGVDMPVTVGSRPTGIFQECIPVVVTGRVVEAPGTPAGLVFEGDEVLVKHDEQYDAANGERLAQGEAEAAACRTAG